MGRIIWMTLSVVIRGAANVFVSFVEVEDMEEVNFCLVEEVESVEDVEDVEEVEDMECVEDVENNSGIKIDL